MVLVFSVNKSLAQTWSWRFLLHPVPFDSLGPFSWHVIKCCWKAMMIKLSPYFRSFWMRNTSNVYLYGPYCMICSYILSSPTSSMGRMLKSVRMMYNSSLMNHGLSWSLVYVLPVMLSHFIQYFTNADYYRMRTIHEIILPIARHGLYLQDMLVCFTL
jgi:hypothetical protein